MLPKDLLSTLTMLFKQEERNTVLMITGAPGLGKTAIVGQAAEAARKELLTFALPTCESVDLRGLPETKERHDKMGFSTSTQWTRYRVVDELASAAPDVQVAAHHLVRAEPGSDMSLPIGWHIVLTGNRAQDKTLYRAVSAPLRNRMTLVNLEPDAKQWCQWAMDNNLNSVVIAFMRFRSELLTAKEMPSEGAFPSPRAWESVSGLLSLSVHAGIERELISGTVGEGATTEFMAFLRTSRELPSIEAILANPKKADVPKSPAVLYALATALASYTRSNEIGAMEYVSRMPAEFALLYVTDVRDKYDISQDPHVRKWVSEHVKLFERETQ